MGGSAMAFSRCVNKPIYKEASRLILRIFEIPVVDVEQLVVERIVHLEGAGMGSQLLCATCNGPCEPVGAVAGSCEAPDVGVLVAGNTIEVVIAFAFKRGLKGHLVGDEGFNCVNLSTEVGRNDGVESRQRIGRCS